ncbi:MAG: GAF domain-containing protein, partial [Candidatus Cloacimonadota bacterium]|nr:GAF domain-containing protein [Candidatus Cloacimonadota bacterium]
MKTAYQTIIDQIEQFFLQSKDKNSILQGICEILESKIEYYDWVGFYLVNEDKQDELILGPYVGTKTEHTNISFGKGICGQVAETHKTFIVQDVQEENNYLACSLNVKSEIVEPIMKSEKFIGEL